MGMILANGLQFGVSSIPEVQEYAGQDFGSEFASKVFFKLEQILLLGFNHRTLKRLWENPETRDHPNVQRALETGMLMVRKWKKTLPRDAAEALAKHGNNFHGGDAGGFTEVLRTLTVRIDPGFTAFKDQKKLEEDALPAEGAEYNTIFWKYVSPRWGSLFNDKQQFIGVRSLQRRLNSLKCYELVMSDASMWADFSSGKGDKDKTLKAMLLVTECFEKEFKHSLPPEPLIMAVRMICRFCYVNVKSADSSHYDMEISFVIDTPEKAVLAISVLKCDMSQSAVYKAKTIKAIKGMSSDTKSVAKSKKDKDKTDNADDEGDGDGHDGPARGKKADAAKAAKKRKRVAPSEEMKLMIATAKETRPIWFLEDQIKALNGSCSEECKDTIDKQNFEASKMHTGLAWHDWSFKTAENPNYKFDWLGNTYSGKWLVIRKDGKYRTANDVSAMVETEAADTAFETVMTTLSTQAEERIPQWQRLLDDADIHLSLICFRTKLWNATDHKDCTLFRDIMAACEGLAKADFQSILNKVHAHMATVVSPAIRSIANDVAAEVEQEKVFPVAAKETVGSQADCEALMFSRAKLTIAVLEEKNAASSKIIQLLNTHSHKIGHLDTLVHERSLWLRVWRWLMADMPSDADKDQEFEHRLEQVTVMLNPELCAGDESHESSSAASAGGGKAQAPAKENAKAKASTRKEPLVNYMNKFAICYKTPATETEDAKVQWIPMSLVNKLIDFLNHAANEHTTGKNKWDVGYTYISFEFEEKKSFLSYS